MAVIAATLLGAASVAVVVRGCHGGGERERRGDRQGQGAGREETGHRDFSNGSALRDIRNEGQSRPAKLNRR
jgi:hypothetical protein